MTVQLKSDNGYGKELLHFSHKKVTLGHDRAPLFKEQLGCKTEREWREIICIYKDLHGIILITIAKTFETST